MKILSRFEKKLHRFEASMKKYSGVTGRQRVNNVEDELFDLNGSNDERDLLDSDDL